MKRLLALLLAVMLLPAAALAEGTVINLIENPDAEYAFQEGVTLLEVGFPQLVGADGFVLRFGEETMLVDCGTSDQAARVAETLGWMGIDRINTAFTTHPHEDHVTGYIYLPKEIALDRFVYTFPEDENVNMTGAIRYMKSREIPMEKVGDGHIFQLGEATATVIARKKSWFTVNDRSAMLMVQYGDRRLLLSADVELSGQNELLKNPPECGLEADVLKYPHHAVDKAGWNFLKHVNAELAIVTNRYSAIKVARKDSEKRGLPLVCTAERPVRLRTDGVIWVLDYLPGWEEPKP